MIESIYDSVGIILGVAAGWTVASMLTALALLVRKWDRASEGLVAGTHKSWQEEAAQNIREALSIGDTRRVELDVSLNAKDFQAAVSRAADALARLQESLLGFREPIEATVETMQGIVRVSMRPGVRLTHTHVGAGRYKVTYTEGTIID